MAGMCLDNHRTAGRQCGGGIASGNGKGQREVAGAEYGHRTQCDAVLADIRPGQRLAFGESRVNPDTQKIAATQHLGKEAQLVTGALPFTANPGFRQPALLHYHLNEVIIQLIQFPGNRFQKNGTLFNAGLPESHKSRCGSRNRLLNFLSGRFKKSVGKRCAGRGIKGGKCNFGLGYPLAVDKLFSENIHNKLPCPVIPAAVLPFPA